MKILEAQQKNLSNSKKEIKEGFLLYIYLNKPSSFAKTKNKRKKRMIPNKTINLKRSLKNTLKVKIASLKSSRKKKIKSMIQI